ncbi:SPOC domain-containing protein 1 isoform X2 [Sminthopsis crassicaudata]|uniref:SPOC domain-containing protein 1 isoform X2 n=1 Tax=Sminthopsis crassicaudata TaxID=9301 RepID=UPI003D692B6E
MSGDGEEEDAFGPKDVLLYSPDGGPFAEDSEGAGAVLSWAWEPGAAAPQWSLEPEAGRSKPLGMDCQEDSDAAEEALRDARTVGGGPDSESGILGADGQPAEDGEDSLLFPDLHIQPPLAPMERKAQFLEKLHVALHDILAENWGKKLGHVAQSIGLTGKGEKSEQLGGCPKPRKVPGDELPEQRSPGPPINHVETLPEMRWLTPVAFPECLSEVCEQGIFSRLALEQDTSVDCPLDNWEEAKEGEKLKRQQPDASPPSPSLAPGRANKKSRLSTSFREVRKRKSLREEDSWKRNEGGRAGGADPKVPASPFQKSSQETCGLVGDVAGTSPTAERERRQAGKAQPWTCSQKASSPHGPTEPLLPNGADSREAPGRTPTKGRRGAMTATLVVEALGLPDGLTMPSVMPASKTSCKSPGQCPQAVPLESLKSSSRLSEEVSGEDQDLGFAVVPKAITGDDDAYFSDVAEELESVAGKGVVAASGANRGKMLGSPAGPQGLSSTNQPCGQADLDFPQANSSSKGPVAGGASLDPEKASESSKRAVKHRRTRSRAVEKPKRGVLSSAQEWGRNGGSRVDDVGGPEPGRVSKSKEEEERTLPRLPNGVKLVCYLGTGSSVRLLGAVSQAWEPKQPPQLEELEDLSIASSETPSQGSQPSSGRARGSHQEKALAPKATKEASGEGEKKPSQVGKASAPAPVEKPQPPAETKVREQKKRPPKEKPLPGPGPPLQLSGEQVRSAVAESLREVLLKRLQEPANLTVGEETVRGIAANIEAAIFDLMQCTDYRYKTKYRSLVFNLRDPRNKDLFLQVIRGDITPQGLVRMSATELASQELAEWRDREVKHEPASHMDLSLRHQSGAAESHSGRDTTEQHESHFLDPDCRVCMGWEAPRGGRGFNAPRSTPSSRSKVTSTPQKLPGPVSLPRVDTPLPGVSKSRSGPWTQPQDRPELAFCPKQALKPKALQGRPLWEGALEMFSIKRFATKAFLVHGYSSQLIQTLPKVIRSAGCVLPETVWDYLDSIWPTEAKDISVVRLCPLGAHDAQNYNMLYSYLNNKQRYGMAASEHLDMFLVPLPAFQPVPPKLRPLGGPGLEVTHCSLVLGLILPKAPPGDLRLNGASPLQEKKRKTVTFKETVETKCYSPGFRRPPSQSKAGPSWAPGASPEGPSVWDSVPADLLEEVAGHVEQEQLGAGRGPYSLPFCCQQEAAGPRPDGPCPLGSLPPQEPLPGWAQLGGGGRMPSQRAQPFSDSPGLVPLGAPLHPECGGLAPELGALSLLQLAGLFHFGSPPAVALAPAPTLLSHPPAADCFHFPEHAATSCPHTAAGAGCPPPHPPLLPTGEALTLIQHLEALVKMNSQLQASLQVAAPDPSLPGPGAGGAPGPMGMECPGREAESQECPPPPLFLTPFCGSEQPPPGY